jgi:hypothetical protein
MSEQFVPLARQSPADIAQKLHEIGDEEAAQVYQRRADHTAEALESRFLPPRAYLNSQHQVGFIPRFTPGTERFQPVVAASNAPADPSLKNGRINIRLDHLRIYEYPQPLLGLGGNSHTILFTFEARNQLPGGSEAVAFNQTYRARSGQDTAVTGNPIFIGLSVGADGVVFSCKTVNVANSSDEQLVGAINSEAATLGLNLLTTAQPALAPFVGVARGLCNSLATRRRNTAVQEITLGLDFESGATGARLAVGSYVVVQVERANEITWSDWRYDTETGTVVRTNLAEGEDPYVLPYNAIVFRVSPYGGA